MNSDNGEIYNLRVEMCKTAEIIGRSFGGIIGNSSENSSKIESLAVWASACERLTDLTKEHIALTGRGFDFEVDPEWDESYLSGKSR